MGAALRWAAATLLVAAFAHAALLFGGPWLVMNRAFESIAQRGASVNAWAFAERVTPDNQWVIRSSPDLAYASCVWSLRDGPVVIRAAPATDYASLSLYAANTDNFFTVNDRAFGREGVEIVLIAPGAPPPAGVDPARVVRAPTMRGVALDRRLAPTKEAFAAVDAARKTSNLCAPYPS